MSWLINGWERYKSDVNTAIEKAISGGGINFSSSFEIEIKRGMPDNEAQYRFAIHHSIQDYPKDERLKSWSKDEAMVPWVALASEIEVSLWWKYMKIYC